MSHAFISYKHDDPDMPLSFMGELFEQLREAKIPFWQDKNNLRAGDEWFEKIDTALETAFAIVVIMTPEAHKSAFIVYEWTRMLGFGITPLVVQLSDRDTNHPKLNTYESLDFRGNKRPWMQLIRELRLRQEEESSRTRDPLSAQLVDAWKFRIKNASPDRSFGPAELIEAANAKGILSAQDKAELFSLLAKKGFFG